MAIPPTAKAAGILATHFMKNRDSTEIQNEAYLRVLVNSICNSRCYFCHSEGVSNLRELDAEMLTQAVKDSAALGFKKIKYSGGEPTLRKDLSVMTRAIKQIDPSIEVSMTTNGFLLRQCIDELIEAGLDRFNVSLHSLDRQTFRKMYGVDRLDDVLEGIDYSLKRKFNKIKVNLTVSSYNLDEIQRIGEYCAGRNLEFRIHDLLPSNNEARKTMIPLEDIKTYLANKAKEIKSRASDGKLMTTYVFDSFKVDIKGRNMGKKCNGCSYISKCGEGIYAVRLDTEGILHPCLYREDLQLDYASSVKKGNSLVTMKEAYKRMVA